MSSTAPLPTFAAIDLGSNSFRLLICRPAGKSLIPLCKELVTVRLSQGMTGQQPPLISQTASERARAALLFFRQRLDDFQVSSCRVCTTEAIRIAANRETFLREAAAILAAPIEILQGTQEAHLSYLGAVRAFSHLDVSPIVADVGGGSSEVIYQLKEQTFSVSLPLGAVRLSEMYSLAGVVGSSCRERIVDHVLDLLNNKVELPPLPYILIGTGGTATAMAALHLGLVHYDEKRVHGLGLLQEDVKALISRLSAITSRQRNLLPGLDQGRGEIILGGILIFLGLMEYCDQREMMVSDSGLLEGILFSILDDSGYEFD